MKSIQQREERKKGVGSECLLKEKLLHELLQFNGSGAAKAWCVGKQQRWAPHPPYRGRARGRCNIHTDHHPGNSGCGSFGPANGWRAGAAKAVIELTAEQRLEEKGGGTWKGNSLEPRLLPWLLSLGWELCSPSPKSRKAQACLHHF